MGYYDNDAADTEGGVSSANKVMAIFVRSVGMVLLLAGLALAILVMMEAWSLYKYPERIEVYARAVEKGSNIDQALAPRSKSARARLLQGGLNPLSEGDSQSGTPPAESASEAASANLRLSYFFAWFIVFILIMLIARIALSAVSTGGKLALYDTEVKKFARALVEETRGKRR